MGIGGVNWSELDERVMSRGSFMMTAVVRVVVVVVVVVVVMPFT